MPSKVCCNPFCLSNHNWIYKNITPVSSSLRERIGDLGDYICLACRMKVYRGNVIPSIQEQENLSDEISFREVSHNINQLEDVECDVPNPQTSSDSDDGSSYVGGIADELLNEIKQVFNEAPFIVDKIKYLTMTPRSWSIRELERNFKTTYRMARKAKQLQDECGFGSSPNPRPSRTLPQSVIIKVINFYISDEISRILPGKKDYVTIRDNNGIKHQVQKRLILCNLKEAYVEFKTQNPDEKIGFSKFAEFRPKQCILVEPAGTHTVCVCKIIKV